MAMVDFQHMRKKCSGGLKISRKDDDGDKQIVVVIIVMLMVIVMMIGDVDS